MEPRPLTSPQNPVAQRFRRVSEGGRGRREGVFLLEGRHIIGEALAAGWPLEVLVVERDLWPRLPPDLRRAVGGTALYTAPRELLARLGTVPSPEGLLALCPRRPPALPEPGLGELYLYLDRVQDPANVGMLVRSARAFGVRGVLCGPGTADPFGPTALARSAGAALHLNPVPVSEEGFLSWAGGHGVAVLAAEASGHPPGSRWAGPAPAALALGNEGRGLSPRILGGAAATLGLPMAPGWDSLNVAVAGSILLYLLSGVVPGGPAGGCSPPALPSP